MSIITGSTALALAPSTLAVLPQGGGASLESRGETFDQLIGKILQSVSDSQHNATTAEAGYSSGLPGNTLGTALVASDRAQVMWNAAVGVRNEVVAAYQTISNMQI
jgi:flagellar hook-basal body complex protein FliE